MKRILAMAIGSKDKSETLISKKAARAPNLRRYIQGLVEGLSEHGQEIGKTFQIDYAEHPIIAAKHFTETDLVFGMSTTVVRAAQEALGDRVPILGIVSDRKVEQFDQSNIACFSARRSQSADDCFRRFMATVPTLKTVHVLHKEGYGPSDRGGEEIRQAAKGRMSRSSWRRPMTSIRSRARSTSWTHARRATRPRRACWSRASTST